MSARLLLRRPAVLASLPAATRPLSISAPLYLKESASSDPNASDYEKHKKDSIEKQKRGQGHWKPELASDSEESVKADRMSPQEAGKEAMKRLQEQTKGRAEETAKHGTSMKDNM
ncbi:hypothetical protein B0T16DRAFT_338669 [Cercophora newfieldiana]|uniref:Mitochondrial carrier protein pet8 protein n=1 Tax=Cercophora newfieldiana TaxID=92897 RepID=A0AA39XS52_9PEZI|nr:hypothetical protein B0T16DRAFT_338669 [Cercophora newfieldiana]